MHINIHILTYAISAGIDSVYSGINSSQLDFALELSGSLSPVGSEVLAMTAPRGKELHEPHVIALQYQLLKIAVCQLNDVLRISSLLATVAATAAATTATSLACQTLIDQLFQLSETGIDNGTS